MLKSFNGSFLMALLLIFPCEASAEDYITGVGRLEPLFKIEEGPPRDITEDQLKDLPLSDPKLRVAYFWLIRGAVSEITDNQHPGLVEVLKDVIRRGDGSTRLWLDIMAKNPDTSLEYKIPIIIGRIGTINMAPFADYLRNVILTRGDTINGALFEVALDTFFEYGDNEDVQLALDLAKKRPFLADYVQSAVETDRRRKAGSHTKPSIPAPFPAAAQAGDPPAPQKVPTTNPVPSRLPQEPASSPAWLVMAAILGITILLLFRFVLKRRK